MHSNRVSPPERRATETVLRARLAQAEIVLPELVSPVLKRRSEKGMGWAGARRPGLCRYHVKRGAVPRTALNIDTMKYNSISSALLTMFILGAAGCHHHPEEEHEEPHKIVVTSPAISDVTATEQYVCQIHSSRHIEVKALESGYLEKIPVNEGQTVQEGDLLFKIVPTLYQARLDSDLAEAQQVQIEFNNTQKLFQKHVVSQQEVALASAKLAKAQAKVDLSRAELNFTNVRAPFNGVIDRLHQQQGSLIAEGDILTTLSDNSVMWVYFNVPEVRYLEYRMQHGTNKDDLTIELTLAGNIKFDQPGRIGAIEADFNNETGNIAFRADFPNPNGLLRHGQTGSVLIHHTHNDAIVIPQRATFEILDKRYVFVVDADDVVHQREITVGLTKEDIFVIEKGLDPDERFVLAGVRQVHDGEKVECEFEEPAEALSHLKVEAQ